MEIVSSDFLRTRETAEVFASVVGFPIDKIQFDTRLRERYFGSIDMTSDGSYAKVWERDAHHESLEDFNAEEPDSVAARGLAVLKEHIKVIHGFRVELVSIVIVRVVVALVVAKRSIVVVRVLEKWEM